MSNLDELIARLTAVAREKGGRAFSSDTVYADEPIVRRGSQMESYLPEACRQMRNLARTPEARGWTDARLFVEQGRLMADYEDDFPYHGTFTSYFPTYDAMSNPQLRGYFSWRTRVRQGSIEQTSTSFAYVYLYELLNGIGVVPNLDGFAAIHDFWQAYREFEPGMDRYVRQWLVDYVVWYGLDATLAAPYVNETHDRAVGLLERAEKNALTADVARGRKRASRAWGADPAGDAELFDALDELSTYRPRASRLFADAEHADDLRAVCCAVFESLVRYYQKSRTQGLVASLFGTRHALPHLMFASAVFYPGGRHEDVTFQLSETCSYKCHAGIWTCDSFHDGGGRSSKLGQALRASDRLLREALGYPHPLKEQGEPKYLVSLITREVTDYLAWKRTHAPRRVEIDLSQLAGIRTAAAETCESLLVDEEREEAPSEISPAPEPELISQFATDSLGLTPEERAFLRALLAGQAPEVAHLDLLVDAINEKLFDLLGDTALEFDASGAPVVIEDYADDVRAALG